MKIGIDLSVLQTPHRMRGIGYVVINFINNLPNKYKKDINFIFYLYNKPENDPLKLLNLNDYDYELRYIKEKAVYNFNLPSRLKLANSLLNRINERKELYFGDSRTKDICDLDYFMQFDQNQPLPPKYKVKSVLILYDIIPYVMESDYLWSYKTARLRGRKIKSAIKCAVLRINYKKRQKLITKKAHKLIAISKHTKNDFVKYIGLKESRISVCYLGVSSPDKNLPKEMSFEQYIKTSWGSLKEPVDLKDKKYILFIGGADPRRKLVDLAAAFNNLVAKGEDLYLVLAGDTMLGADLVPNLELQEYLKHTSYLNRIYFLGFVNDKQKSWLYKNAVAFVYPSLYEGFGLPILEALSYGTNVITYNNTSIKEICNHAVYYAANFLDIEKNIINIKNNHNPVDHKYIENFSWQNSTENIIKLTTNS